uniref:Uncharacterized protein n=1 Tax=Romanomermis culicivorax TaxID=13658 RepID=A0A915J4D9_ROMCU
MLGRSLVKKVIYNNLTHHSPRRFTVDPDQETSREKRQPSAVQYFERCRNAKKRKNGVVDIRVYGRRAFMLVLYG